MAIFGESRGLVPRRTALDARALLYDTCWSQKARKGGRVYSCIVVGNKGMTGITRFLLGSVPSKVAHHASCSVLIVRTT